jgi:hypothetical protein
LSPSFLGGLVDGVYFALTVFTGVAHLNPKTPGGKAILMAQAWFTLIMVASYTANLASALTLNDLDSSIKEWKDITDSRGSFSLSVERDSSQLDFLDAELRHYGHKFTVELYDTWEETIHAVIDGEVDATLVPLPDFYYYVQNDIPHDKECAAMKVGDLIHNVGYTIAFGENDGSFIKFSHILMDMKEQGELVKITEEIRYSTSKVDHLTMHRRLLCELHPLASIAYLLYLLVHRVLSPKLLTSTIP